MFSINKKIFSVAIILFSFFGTMNVVNAAIAPGACICSGSITANIIGQGVGPLLSPDGSSLDSMCTLNKGQYSCGLVDCTCSGTSIQIPGIADATFCTALNSTINSQYSMFGSANLTCNWDATATPSGLPSSTPLGPPSGLAPAAPTDVPIDVSSLSPSSSINTLTLPQYIGRVLRNLLGFAGVLTLLVFIYAGVRLMYGADKDSITKAKDSFIWASLGLAVIFSGYVVINTILGTLISPPTGGTGGVGSAASGAATGSLCGVTSMPAPFSGCSAGTCGPAPGCNGAYECTPYGWNCKLQPIITPPSPGFGNTQQQCPYPNVILADGTCGPAVVPPPAMPQCFGGQVYACYTSVGGARTGYDTPGAVCGCENP